MRNFHGVKNQLPIEDVIDEFLCQSFFVSLVVVVCRRVLGSDWGKAQRSRDGCMWACYTLFTTCSLVLLDSISFFINSIEIDSSCYMTFKTFFYFVLQRLPLIEEQLGKLVTDDPSVIETTLEQYGDLVHPGSSSVLQRFDRLVSHSLLEKTIQKTKSYEREGQEIKSSVFQTAFLSIFKSKQRSLFKNDHYQKS